jgi:hypothetical protein
VDSYDLWIGDIALQEYTIFLSNGYSLPLGLGIRTGSQVAPLLEVEDFDGRSKAYAICGSMNERLLISPMREAAWCETLAIEYTSIFYLSRTSDMFRRKPARSQ